MLADVAPTVLELLGDEQPRGDDGPVADRRVGDGPFRIEPATGPPARASFHPAHGEVARPAFVPLATTGREVAACDEVRRSASRWCSATRSICSSSRARSYRAHGRPARVHGLAAADHHRLGRLPGLLDGPRLGGGGDQGRRTNERQSRILAIDEEGVRFRSYIDGGERFMGPETSMEVQAALGSDIALAFDECTPFHVDRDYTARSTERTHRWLDRCIDWQRATRPAGQLLYGIVQGGVYEDLRRASAERVARSASTAWQWAGRWGRRRSRCARWWAGRCGRCRDEKPRHLLGIGDVDDILASVAAGIDTFDCATPTRLGRHGTALVPDPEARWRLDLTKARWRESREPIAGGLPVPGVPRAHARLPALPLQAGELTGDAAAHAPQPHVHGAADGRLRAAIRGGRRARPYSQRGAWAGAARAPAARYWAVSRNSCSRSVAWSCTSPALMAGVAAAADCVTPGCHAIATRISRQQHREPLQPAAAARRGGGRRGAGARRSCGGGGPVVRGGMPLRLRQRLRGAGVGHQRRVASGS